MATRSRLDLLLVRRGLAESREKAQALIMAGDVLVAQRQVDKAGALVSDRAEVEVREPLRYVSRGGLKLEAALRYWGLDVAGLTLIDVGASTGGFTDCLLQHGARRVYAVDVGYGQLHWRLRQDPRVVVLERTNARYLGPLPELADAAVVDVSFISLTLVLPPLIQTTKPDAWIVALLKPQFEAGREQVARGGVIRDPAVHRQVLRKFFHWAGEKGLSVRDVVPSPLLGPAGNREFFVYLTVQAQGQDQMTIQEADGLVDRCLQSGPAGQSSSPCTLLPYPRRQAD